MGYVQGFLNDGIQKLFEVVRLGSSSCRVVAESTDFDGPEHIIAILATINYQSSYYGLIITLHKINRDHTLRRISMSFGSCSRSLANPNLNL